MDLEKLKKIAGKSSGGGGAPRRKTKSGAGKAANNVESKVRSAARSLKAQEISPRFDDVMLIRTDGSAVGLRQPRIDAKLESNMYVVSSDNAEIRSAMQVQSIKQQMDQQAMTMALQQMGMGGMMKQAEERLATMKDGGENMTKEELAHLVDSLGSMGAGGAGGDDDDDVPELVGNFDEVHAH
mmetsp:Transcript_10126/g.27590  ORF Transcript_10126/g.27590 Transcript_10126/m.27590 type:complete len:183 (-) Transcript_10126:2329-2877(-)